MMRAEEHKNFFDKAISLASRQTSQQVSPPLLFLKKHLYNYLTSHVRTSFLFRVPVRRRIPRRQNARQLRIPRRITSSGLRPETRKSRPWAWSFYCANARRKTLTPGIRSKTCTTWFNLRIRILMPWRRSGIWSEVRNLFFHWYVLVIFPHLQTRKVTYQKMSSLYSTLVQPRSKPGLDLPGYGTRYFVNGRYRYYILVHIVYTYNYIDYGHSTLFYIPAIYIIRE